MQIWYMMQSMSRFAESQDINFPDPFSTFVRVTHLIKLDLGRGLHSSTSLLKLSRFCQ
jgi:hypothetical protein